jgi:hypothetical protein
LSATRTPAPARVWRSTNGCNSAASSLSAPRGGRPPAPAAARRGQRRAAGG